MKSVLIDAPAAAVFHFHERADALELLTPAFPPVKVLSRNGGIEEGARVELSVMGLRWIALHTRYERDRLFVDEQIRGPFAQWTHRHEFEDLGAQCRLTDRVEYRLPFANALLGWLVKPGLARMFHHRHAITKRICEQK